MWQFRIGPGRVLLPVVAGLLLIGCGSSSKSSVSTTVATTTSATAGTSSVIVGAGSTFVFPLVSQWTADYNKKAGVTVTYGAIGSGGGISAITSRSVDFGASDAPLTADQATACNSCVEVPWALGGTAVAYHLTSARVGRNVGSSFSCSVFAGRGSASDEFRPDASSKAGRKPP